MNARKTTIIAAFYVAIGVVTFGHAAANRDREYAQCVAAQAQDWCGNDDGGAAGLAAFIAWPLYWSWEAWS